MNRLIEILYFCGLVEVETIRWRGNKKNLSEDLIFQSRQFEREEIQNPEVRQERDFESYLRDNILLKVGVLGKYETIF